MLRLTEVKLPLDHAEADLAAAAATRLGVPAADVKSITIFRRAVDARKKAAILLIYTLDVEAADEAAVLARLGGDRSVSVAPDTGYHFVTRAPETLTERPLVIFRLVCMQEPTVGAGSVASGSAMAGQSVCGEGA